MLCLIDFKEDIENIELPEFFTNPFDYSPHTLCLQAAKQLQSILPEPDPNEKGKMYGVLIVKDQGGKVGFLAAYSGNEQNITHSIPFVPQVFDITNPAGFFRKGEAELNKINAEISKAENSPQHKGLQLKLKSAKEESKDIIDKAKATIKEAKKRREHLRAEAENANNKEKLFDQLINESQTEKSQFNRLKKELKQKVDDTQQQLDLYLQQIKNLKQKRKKRSAQLQQRLFDNYIFLNVLTEEKSASAIFSNIALKTPPAGTGDCCAPKLLQYAFLNQLKPIAMAEFWWGASPKKEIRHHAYFYPACNSKCKPILGHMLSGLKLEHYKKPIKKLAIEVIYEDDTIAVINKPAGLLSVPGKENHESAYSQVKTLYPMATGPLIVHRLDMATSGLMLIALNKEAHEHLQKQFLNKSIRKKYVAIVDGIIEKDSGTINLPLRVDLDDRPRQLVCFEHGKEAISKWEVIERYESQTKIHFYPISGRTHQLRLHAAHIKGLNAPIVGDQLYGLKAERLLLHAEEITFIHPGKLEQLTFSVQAEF